VKQRLDLLGLQDRDLLALDARRLGGGDL